jgi:hypothetical protein
MQEPYVIWITTKKGISSKVRIVCIPSEDGSDRKFCLEECLKLDLLGNPCWEEVQLTDSLQIIIDELAEKLINN